MSDNGAVEVALLVGMRRECGDAPCRGGWVRGVRRERRADRSVMVEGEDGARMRWCEAAPEMASLATVDGVGDGAEDEDRGRAVGENRKR